MDRHTASLMQFCVHDFCADAQLVKGTALAEEEAGLADESAPSGPEAAVQPADLEHQGTVTTKSKEMERFVTPQARVIRCHISVDSACMSVCTLCHMLI